MENEADIPQPGRDDRLLPLTRAVAWLVIPFLLAAFVILYVDGRHTANWFAWEIGSRLTTALMGAGYLGGSYLFLRTALGGSRPPASPAAAGPTAVGWHQVQIGFLPVTVFTVAMLLATLLHWDKFLTDHWPFWVWLALYVITPLLVPFVWWRNRRTDPGRPAAGERLIPGWLRVAVGLIGAAMLALSVAAFARPQLLIPLWPWALTPLTARVMAGWHALLGTGALAMSGEERWSGWVIPMQSIAIWMLLLAGALLWHRDELGAAGLVNWYTVFVLSNLGGALLVAWIMRGQEPLP